MSEIKFNTQAVLIVTNAVFAFNEISEKPIPMGLEPSLIGENGVVDSLGLVALLLFVEDSIKEQTGKHITLANDGAFSRKNSPFATVGSLVEYVNELI